MRDFKGMKRQRGRNRGGGGGKPQQNANRAFDSNGPDGVKVRGNAQHVFEKYQQLARDASSAGDRVLAENYLQHAEHYFRLLRALQPNRPASEIIGRDQFASGFDIDFEDETIQAQAEAADEAAQEAAEARAAGGGVSEDGGEQNRNRDRDRERDRDRDRDRGEWQGRDGENRRDGEGRRDRWRDRRNRDRDERPRGEGDERRDRFERPERADPLAVVQPQGDGEREERRDDRREERREERNGGPMLRDAEGGESHAPAFLQSAPRAPAAEAGEEKPARPRRRRAPRSFEGGEGEPATANSED
jgi:hypothetical protein